MLEILEPDTLRDNFKVFYIDKEKEDNSTLIGFRITGVNEEDDSKGSSFMAMTKEALEGLIEELQFMSTFYQYRKKSNEMQVSEMQAS